MEVRAQEGMRVVSRLPHRFETPNYANPSLRSYYFEQARARLLRYRSPTSSVASVPPIVAANDKGRFWLLVIHWMRQRWA